MTAAKDDAKWQALLEEEERKNDYDVNLEVEVQTDKKQVKMLPCRGCKRVLVVSTFYAPASKATCSACKAESGDGAITVPVPGKSDPHRVENLREVLVNSTFGKALCPVHPEDPAHEMELKAVSHSEFHGPSELVGYKNGLPVFDQRAPGETVMHQCLKCKATVSYSTTAQVQFTRQNEARSTKGPGVNTWLTHLEAREEKAASATEVT